jgi:hypothetical protein
MTAENEKDIDGCDAAIDNVDATADEALPAAEGGVAVEQNEDDIDGCDAQIHEWDATPDKELPAAEGGVV